MPELKIEYWPIERLIFYARNPRKNEHAVPKMASLIKEFGFKVPIVARSDGSVVDGHLRLMAARHLGMETVPVVLADEWTPAQVKAFRIAVNKSAEFAEWDTAMLALEIEDLKELDFDLELTGFELPELDEILGAGADGGTEGQTDPDAVPEAQEEPVSRLGDVWLLGRHRLMCGDSTDAGSVALLMNGSNADLLLTDPPYNVSYEGGTKDRLTILNDSMDDEKFRSFLADAFKAADTVMKNGAAFYIWHADSEGYNFRGAVRDTGWMVRQCLIWVKNSMVLGRQDYQWKHEPCLYGWKDGAAHLWTSDRRQTTVLEFNKPNRNGEHPTMKPVELFEYQMLNSTNREAVVLDLFGGSGTTMIAAEKNGRSARLMELDPRYCDVIVRRWQDFTGQEATLEEDGRTFAQVKEERGG